MFHRLWLCNNINYCVIINFSVVEFNDNVTTLHIDTTPTEAVGAQAIGGFFTGINVMLLILLIYSDLGRLISDFRRGYRNVKSALVSICVS